MTNIKYLRSIIWKHGTIGTYITNWISARWNGDSSIGRVLCDKMMSVHIRSRAYEATVWSSSVTYSCRYWPLKKQTKILVDIGGHKLHAEMRMLSWTETVLHHIWNNYIDYSFRIRPNLEKILENRLTCMAIMWWYLSQDLKSSSYEFSVKVVWDIMLARIRIPNYHRWWSRREFCGNHTTISDSK